jgi:predicted Ser/Thr protein kinase
MQSIEEIQKLTLKVSFLKNPTISFLSEGFGNYNYLVQEEGVKYVLRIKKSGEVQFLDSLEREFVFLKYFRSQGIHFCPEVYFYDKEDNFLIESFLEGEEVVQKDFSDKQIDLFAKQLHQLYKLNVPAFTSFCSDNGYREFDWVSPLVSLDTYGFKRFEQAKQSGLNNKMSDWIEPRLKRNLDYLTTVDQKESGIGFAWGDIQSRVIIGNDQRMYFYDFEHVTIANSFGLSYVKIHGSFSDAQFDSLVERCAFHFDSTTEELLAEIAAEETIIRVNDVVWAAMMWSRTGDKKFETTMQERVGLVEKLG